MELYKEHEYVKTFLCYMRDSTCRWCIAENAKIFWSYVQVHAELNRRL